MCVSVCVTETHLWKQLSWPPSPLPHPVPTVSQQLTLWPPPLLCFAHIPQPPPSSLSSQPLPLSYLFCRQPPSPPSPAFLPSLLRESPFFILIHCPFTPEFFDFLSPHPDNSCVLLSSSDRSSCQSTHACVSVMCCKQRCWLEAGEL